MANRRYTQFYYTGHNYPVQLDCAWTVDATNSSGVTGLTGAGIQHVWMHTSTTPATGNPNPAVGYAVVQFQDNFNGYYFGGCQFQSPLTGSSLLIASAGLTAGLPYVITILGTTTLAQWQHLGVPVGITPAVGVSFIALATSATGTGAVQLALATGSGISSVDVLGTPSTTIVSSAGNVPGSSSGAYLILRFLGATSSSVTTFVATEPAAGTVIRANFLFSNSRILNKGS